MLEPNEKQMLTRALELSEQNNKILTKIHRAMKWARFFHTLYWIIVIGTAIGAYYLIQPYVSSVFTGLGDFSENVKNVKNIFNPDGTDQAQ